MSTAVLQEIDVKTAEQTAPYLIPQPRGGALLSGGQPGNKGGRGIPSEIRKTLRLSFQDRVPVLEAIADNAQGVSSDGDRIRAVDTIGKYGLGERAELTVVHPDVIAKLQETVGLIAGREEWRSEELIPALSEIWR